MLTKLCTFPNQWKKISNKINTLSFLSSLSFTCHLVYRYLTSCTPYKYCTEELIKIPTIPPMSWLFHTVSYDISVIQFGIMNYWSSDKFPLTVVIYVKLFHLSFSFLCLCKKFTLQKFWAFFHFLVPPAAKPLLNDSFHVKYSFFFFLKKKYWKKEKGHGEVWETNLYFPI